MDLTAMPSSANGAAKASLLWLFQPSWIRA